MRLNSFTDYSLRVLIYTAARDPDMVSITEIAEAYNVSRNHLVKVVGKLSKLGYLNTTRGSGGGIRLARLPEYIVIGDVVQATEPDFDMVECFRPGNKCRITPACRLKGVLNDAKMAFLKELSAYTLADIMIDRESILEAFRPVPEALISE